MEKNYKSLLRLEKKTHTHIFSDWKMQCWENVSYHLFDKNIIHIVPQNVKIYIFVLLET